MAVQLGKGDAVAAIEEALRHLLCTISVALDGDIGDSHQVVLDAAVDNYRCIVIKAPEARYTSHHELSPREQEIARMVAQGQTNKTIARVLDISIWTVSSHLRRAFAKLAVTTRAALVAKLAQDQDPVAIRDWDEQLATMGQGIVKGSGWVTGQHLPDGGSGSAGRNLLSRSG